MGDGSTCPVRHPTSQDGSARAREDEKQREDLQATYVQLLKELETERERRWKAEHAARRLADHIKDVQAKQNEENELKITAVAATGRLKEVLVNERDAKVRLQDQVTALQTQVAELQEQLSRARQAEDANRAAVRSLEETLAGQERQRLQQQAHEAKKIQESELRAAALARELEITRGNSKAQKGQIQQLQELLATREQQHKIETLSHQYSQLEDEFRLALQIEAGKFREIQTAFERVSAENAENKQLLVAAQKKDENTSVMLSELTALVKEQKGRITELSRAKQEQASQYRERVETLEASLEEARKRMVQFELLKQESTRLQSTVHAQESIIEGLKAERRLWGQELAQQGASLSQDRGRLEAKIETLQQEIVTLKKQLERETDLVKIKTKMVDDQTETIRKLKEGLLDRDEQIRAAREDTLKVQRTLEEQLAEERAAHQDLQEALEEMRHRKNDLKQQVSTLQAELETSQHAHQQLSARWREKSDLIGSLEKQVSNMKNTWEEREKRLTQERDQAKEAASLAIEKMRSMDDGFRRQLEAAEKSHREELAQVTQEKEQEVHIAEQKVLIVEEEMRRLLCETEQAKRTMEDKVKRLTQALGDLQSDLL
ncbi:leucine-rich repeat and coiled-coil domain-containing protein 1-like isoform X2 [Pomacea canaliculata]|uniref:leucine-rich repeat and coiled-coil domain-containing protein 1-like isoform X2 n=1 Tax=Pomacea canaliculata TaxID=400727 RepID=UPI000D72CA8B|nr:leucine-rich repeat and coiled-coil domain-containing protein 1-like isoform X2 [Pomacea canaliculata]